MADMDSADWERVDAAADRSVRATLTDVGYTQSREPRPGEARAEVTLRGSFSGNVVLAASGDALVESCPMPGADRELLKDWACELANLVVGRLRTEMSRIGLQVDLAPPRSLMGQPGEAEAPAQTPENAHAHAVRVGEFEIVMTIAHVAKGPQATIPPDPNEDVDSLMFF